MAYGGQVFHVGDKRVEHCPLGCCCGYMWVKIRTQLAMLTVAHPDVNAIGTVTVTVTVTASDSVKPAVLGSVSFLLWPLQSST